MNASWEGAVSGVAGEFPRAANIGSTSRRKPQPRGPVDGLVVSIRGALYDATSWRRWLLQLISRMGLQTQYSCFFRLWERDYLCAPPDSQPMYWSALRKYLTSAGMSPGQIDEVIAAGHVRRRCFEENIRPFPGVRATLPRLVARGVHLAAVSSTRWPTEETAGQLWKLKVADQFQTVITGPDAIASPLSYAALLRSTLASMQLPASQTALVSCNSLELTAASALGMQTVSFNGESDAQADVYIEQFDQLLNALDYRSIRSLAG
jgi:phosphoglycolate phosphatase-like HAD superfamily hydrolase